MNCTKNLRRSADKKSHRGASLVEYGLLVGLIAAICITAVGFIGKSTSKSFSNIGSSLASQ